MLRVFTDGGSRGNPGPAACAFYSREKRGKYLGIMTNNEAEYEAVILAWEWLQNQDFDQVEFFSDSSLVVNQLNGKFKIKEARLREKILKIRSLEKGKFTYNLVPRSQNLEADLLVNQTLDSQMR